MKSLGSRQVVRHRILIPAFVGSIPTSPARFFALFPEINKHCTIVPVNNIF